MILWHFESDVLVYEVIETQEGFTPRYSGAEVTFEQDGNELCAVYNFGKNIIYDRVLKEGYAVGDTVEITILREGVEMTLTCVLQAMPAVVE